MDELLFLNALLFSRLVFIFNDRQLSGKSTTILVSAQAALCLLIFSVGWSTVILAVLVMLAHWVTERWLHEKWVNESRLSSVLVILTASTVLRDQLNLSPWLNTLLTDR